jgi:hypothetical protein
MIMLNIANVTGVFGMYLIKLGAIAIIFLQLASAAKATDRAAVLQAYKAAVADVDDDAAVKRFLAVLPKVKNPLAKGVDFFLVEGDIPMTEKQVRTYLRSKSSGPVIAGEDNPELIVNVEGGKATYWADPAKRTLRYAVMRASFPDNAKFQLALADMAAASGEWVAACPTCGLKFEHVPELDIIADPLEYVDALTKDTIRFVVIFSDVSGANPNDGYIARAFFPDSPAHLRSIILDKSYFDQVPPQSKFTRVGVLRHELGHVLGYRHEHIRGEAGCWSEGGQWKPLTPYDGKSVMHYPCGAASARGDLVLSETDKAGHRNQYRPSR